MQKDQIRGLGLAIAWCVITGVFYYFGGFFYSNIAHTYRFAPVGNILHSFELLILQVAIPALLFLYLRRHNYVFSKTFFITSSIIGSILSIPLLFWLFVSLFLLGDAL